MRNNVNCDRIWEKTLKHFTFFVFLCFFSDWPLDQLVTSAVTKTPHCVSHLQSVHSETPGKGGSSSVGTTNHFALRSKWKMCRDVKHADLVDFTGLWLKPGYTHCGPDQCWNRCWQDNWWKSFFLLSLQQTDAGPISTQSHMKPIRNSCIRLQMRYCTHENLASIRGYFISLWWRIKVELLWCSFCFALP